MNNTRRDLIQRLTDLISQGDIVENGKLPSERELAAKLETSRPLLREALISLEALGLLDIRDRQGIFLAGNNPEDALRAMEHAQVWPLEVLSQVMEIRQILDPGATALAAARRKERDMEKLDECIAMMEKVNTECAQDQATLGAYWNTVLHSTIFKATGNTLLARLYESLLAMSEKGISAMRMDVIDSTTPKHNEETLRHHKIIVEAIRTRDTKRARQASQEHLRSTISTLVALSRVTPVSDFFAQKMDSVLD